MDIRNPALLTTEQKELVRGWESFFNAPAWRWYVEDAKQMREVLQHYLLYNATTEGDIREARGRIIILDQIINLEAFKETEFNSLVDLAEADRDEITESRIANV